MKLCYSPTSPYVRKVMMLAIERGVVDAIERVPTSFQPHDPELLAANPLGKVPTLLLDDGTALYDSPVICEYLDSTPGGRRLFPADGSARWSALRLQALGDCLSDAAVAWRLESIRPDAQQSPAWIERQQAVVRRVLDALETQAGRFAAEPTIGELAVIAALGYLDLRFPDLGWRDRAPTLAGWFAAASERPSARATVPVQP